MIEVGGATQFLTGGVTWGCTGFIYQKVAQSGPKPLDIYFLYFRLQTILTTSRSIGSDWSKVWSKPRRRWKPASAHQDLSELKATPCEEKWYPGRGFGVEFLLGMISIRRRIWWLRFSNSVIPVFSYLSLKIVIVFSNQPSSLSFTLPHKTLWISSCHLFFCGPLLSRQASEPRICIYVVMC